MTCTKLGGDPYGLNQYDGLCWNLVYFYLIESVIIPII